jgi:hypothetical protein
MRFADLKLGDHFIWAKENLSNEDSVTVCVKTAWSEEGGGFAVDLVTHIDCVSPFPHSPYRAGSDPEELKEWIPGDTPVIKLNANL